MLHRGSSTAEPAPRRSARNCGVLPHLQRFIVGKAGPERSRSRSRRRPTRLASGARAAPHGGAAAAAESSERPSSCSRAVVVDLVSPACNSPLPRRASARCKSTARDRASRVAAAEEATRSAAGANQATDAGATQSWCAEFNKRESHSEMKRKAAEAAVTVPKQWAAAAGPSAKIVAIDKELNRLGARRYDLNMQRKFLVATTQKVDQEVAYLQERVAVLTVQRGELEMETFLADQSDVRELEEDGTRQVVSAVHDDSCVASSSRSAEANRMRAMEQQMTAIAAQMSTLVAALGKPQCTNAGATTSLPALGAQGAGQGSEDNNQRRNAAAWRRLGSTDPGR